MLLTMYLMNVLTHSVSTFSLFSLQFLKFMTIELYSFISYGKESTNNSRAEAQK